MLPIFYIGCFSKYYNRKTIEGRKDCSVLEFEDTVYWGREDMIVRIALSAEAKYKAGDYISWVRSGER